MVERVGITKITFDEKKKYDKQLSSDIITWLDYVGILSLYQDCLTTKTLSAIGDKTKQKIFEQCT